jgi:outer membrane biosynthesis protein TonB
MRVSVIASALFFLASSSVTAAPVADVLVERDVDIVEEIITVTETITEGQFGRGRRIHTMTGEHHGRHGHHGHKPCLHPTPTADPTPDDTTPTVDPTVNDTTPAPPADPTPDDTPPAPVADPTPDDANPPPDPTPTIEAVEQSAPPVTTPPPAAAVAPAAAADSSGLDPDAQSALDQHNIFRAQHGVQPLTWSDTLASYAASHAASCVFEHTGGKNLYDATDDRSLW